MNRREMLGAVVAAGALSTPAKGVVFEKNFFKIIDERLNYKIPGMLEAKVS